MCTAASKWLAVPAQVWEISVSSVRTSGPTQFTDEDDKMKRKEESLHNMVKFPAIYYYFAV